MHLQPIYVTSADHAHTSLLYILGKHVVKNHHRLPPHDKLQVLNWRNRNNFLSISIVEESLWRKMTLNSPGWSLLLPRPTSRAAAGESQWKSLSPSPLSAPPSPSLSLLSRLRNTLPAVAQLWRCFANWKMWFSLTKTKFDNFKCVNTRAKFCGGFRIRVSGYTWAFRSWVIRLT